MNHQDERRRGRQLITKSEEVEAHTKYTENIHVDHWRILLRTEKDQIGDIEFQEHYHFVIFVYLSPVKEF